jgi:hypothetical protein
MYSVYQHWDPLEVCVLGRSYPPEFYDHIASPHVRELFQRIASETEQDYQAIQSKLEQFGVRVLRPDLPDSMYHGRFLRPPMTPRDNTVMVHDTFYESVYYPNFLYSGPKVYDHILDYIKSQGNIIKSAWRPKLINGAQIIRLGQDLFFGTERDDYPLDQYTQEISKEFTQTRNHIVNTGGHYDGTCCVVAPGLIISAYDAPTYKHTFPGWEVIYLPNMSFDNSGVNQFTRAMTQTKMKHIGKWWIPGFEKDQAVVDYVDTYLYDWLGYVAETVFDINMLIIDPKNVLVYNENEKVFRALERYGITPHVVPFRHRFFWDGGLHCITSDLNRRGSIQNFFQG